MSYLSLVKFVPGVFNVASVAYDGYKAVKWYIDHNVKQETDEGIQLGKERIPKLLDAMFLTYVLYVAFNIFLLAATCFLNRVFDPQSHTLLAAGYAIIAVKMMLSGRLCAMHAYDRWQRKQLVLNFNGTLYRLLDAQVKDEVKERIERKWPIVQWICKKLDIPTTAKDIIVDGLMDTMRRNVIRFLLCSAVAWSFYIAISHYLAVPLLEGLEDRNWLLAAVYPFYASISLLAKDLFVNPAWSVLFAALFCVLFARTTWCLHRRYGALAAVLAWLLFLVATAAVLHRAHFTCIGTVLLIQSIFTFEKCVTGHYVYPGLTADLSD